MNPPGTPRPPRPPGPDDAAEAYLAVVVRTVQRLAARRHGVDAADELTQLVAQQFWGRRAEYMAHYAPEVFAAVALRSRAEELRRTERIQRGEGARLVDDGEGGRRPGRQVVPLDHDQPGGGPRLVHAGPDPADQATDVALVHGALDRLDERSRRLVLAVDGHGLSVTEAAVLVGLSRPYANRELTRIRAELRRAVSAA